MKRIIAYRVVNHQNLVEIDRISELGSLYYEQAHDVLLAYEDDYPYRPTAGVLMDKQDFQKLIAQMRH